MAKKIIGTSIALPAPFNAGSSNPIDTRFVVETLSDLTNPETYGTSGAYSFVYEGLPVYVSSDKAVYTYMGPTEEGSGVLSAEVAKSENWTKTADKVGLYNLTLSGNNLQLVNKDDNSVVSTLDVSSFIKDGMVSSVTMEGNDLVVTFNTESGKQPIRVSLESLVLGKVTTEQDGLMSKEDKTKLDSIKLPIMLAATYNKNETTEDTVVINTNKATLNKETNKYEVAKVVQVKIPAATFSKAGVLTAQEKKLYAINALSISDNSNFEWPTVARFSINNIQEVHDILIQNQEDLRIYFGSQYISNYTDKSYFTVEDNNTDTLFDTRYDNCYFPNLTFCHIISYNPKYAEGGELAGQGPEYTLLKKLPIENVTFRTPSFLCVTSQLEGLSNKADYDQIYSINKGFSNQPYYSSEWVVNASSSWESISLLIPGNWNVLIEKNQGIVPATRQVFTCTSKRGHGEVTYTRFDVEGLPTEKITFIVK